MVIRKISVYNMILGCSVRTYDYRDESDTILD